MLISVLAVIVIQFVFFGRIFSLTLNRNQCQSNCNTSNLPLNCSYEDSVPNNWHEILQPPAAYRNVTGETRGRSCLTSIRRFVGATAETASHSAILLHFSRLSIWIVLDEVDAVEREWSSNSIIELENFKFQNGSMIAVHPSDIVRSCVL